MTGDHDDRVVPGPLVQVRRRAPGRAGGDAPILIRVETSAGHGAGKPTAKLIAERTDKMAFLESVLGVGKSWQVNGGGGAMARPVAASWTGVDRATTCLDWLDGKRGLGVTIVAAIGAVIAVGVGYRFGGELHNQGESMDRHAPGSSPTLAALASSCSAVMRPGAIAKSWASDRAGQPSVASVIRLGFTIVGIIVVALVTLAMLHIAVSQLLLGGAMTKIVVGFAAQQSLGNTFAASVVLSRGHSVSVTTSA